MADYKMRVRIGDAEFEAEGPESTVRQQFDQFLATITNLKNERSRRLSDEFVACFAANQSVWDRLKQRSSQYTDWILLKIYGALANGDDFVTSTELLTMFRSAGFDIETDRIDRILASHASCVEKTGAKRGTRYALTQHGVDYVEQLMLELMGANERGRIA